MRILQAFRRPSLAGRAKEATCETRESKFEKYVFLKLVARFNWRQPSSSVIDGREGKH